MHPGRPVVVPGAIWRSAMPRQCDAMLRVRIEPDAICAQQDICARIVLTRRESQGTLAARSVGAIPCAWATTGWAHLCPSILHLCLVRLRSNIVGTCRARDAVDDGGSSEGGGGDGGEGGGDNDGVDGSENSGGDDDVGGGRVAAAAPARVTVCLAYAYAGGADGDGGDGGGDAEEADSAAAARAMSRAVTAMGLTVTVAGASCPRRRHWHGARH